MKTEELLKAYAKNIEIDFNSLISKSRKREYVKARQAFYYFCSNNIIPKGAETLSSIGKLTNRNHATVMHGTKEASWDVEFYKDSTMMSHLRVLETLYNANSDYKCWTYYLPETNKWISKLGYIEKDDTFALVAQSIPSDHKAEAIRNLKAELRSKCNEHLITRVEL